MRRASSGRECLQMRSRWRQPPFQFNLLMGAEAVRAGREMILKAASDGSRHRLLHGSNVSDDQPGVQAGTVPLPVFVVNALADYLELGTERLRPLCGAPKFNGVGWTALPLKTKE